MVGFTLQEQQIEDDRHSVHSVHSIASTVATTTSLASRIRDLNIDFGDKLQEQAEEEEAELEQQKEEEQRGGSRASAPSPSSSAGGAHHHHLQHTQPGQSGRSSTELLSNGGVAAAAGADEDLGGVPHSLHLLHRDPPLQPLQVRLRCVQRGVFVDWVVVFDVRLSPPDSQSVCVQHEGAKFVSPLGPSSRTHSPTPLNLSVVQQHTVPDTSTLCTHNHLSTPHTQAGVLPSV